MEMHILFLEGNFLLSNMLLAVGGMGIRAFSLCRAQVRIYSKKDELT